MVNDLVNDREFPTIAERAASFTFVAVDSYGQCNIRGFRGCDAEWISAFEVGAPGVL